MFDNILLVCSAIGMLNCLGMMAALVWNKTVLFMRLFYFGMGLVVVLCLLTGRNLSIMAFY